MLHGSTPMFGLMERIPKDLGHLVGGFVDNWDYSSK